MEQVQVSIPCKTPQELGLLTAMGVKLRRIGFEALILPTSSKVGVKTFALYRSIKQGECDIPTEGYWIFERNQFYRVERVAKLYRKARRKEMKCLSQK